MQAMYLNPYSDYGFKKLFGEDANKAFLLNFLNALLPENSQIADFTFNNTEKLGRSELDRKAVYDIFCTANNGDRFIVELQRVEQNYFKDRTLYYSTFPISEQAKKGPWDFELKAVYCIGILNFTFAEDYAPHEKQGEVLHTVKLKDQNGKIFYDKLTYLYLEMPNFTKKEAELITDLDKWLYFIKNLEDFTHIPEIFQDTVFEDAMEVASINVMTRDERFQYEMSLKVMRDNMNTFNFAVEKAIREGREEGREEGRVEGREEGRVEGMQKGIAKATYLKNIAFIRKGLEKGMAIQDIADFCDLTVAEIQELINELG